MKTYYVVFAREHSDRGNPEDWCTHDYTAAPTYIAGIATTHKGSRNDVLLLFRAGNAVFADFFLFGGGGVLQSRELSF